MIRHWVVLDLEVFRHHESDPLVRREIQDNCDGTHFIAYDIRSFPAELIVAKSPTMAVALDRGVDAVRPLQPKWQADLTGHWSRTDPPPDLQELVLRFGGYDKIPVEAWTIFNQLMAKWKERRR
jgi:hypothetical protein